MVGDNRRIELPDFKRVRVATGRFRGLRCVHTHLRGEQLTQDDLTDLAILRNWLHDATFPLFFERQLPGAEILQEGAASFEGRPAWIGVMRLPHGSALFRNDPETGLPVRQDSYRGLVVFSRDDHTYLIMTEVAPELPWNSFLPKLSEFYRGISFRSPDAPLVLQTFADVQDAGN